MSDKKNLLIIIIIDVIDEFLLRLIFLITVYVGIVCDFSCMILRADGVFKYDLNLILL